MLPARSTISTVDMTAEQAREHMAAIDWVSGVGHADTAALFSTLLGVDIPCNRISIAVPERVYGQEQEAWTAIVGQYSGPRLPEGATTLPEGATIRWVKVFIA